MGLGQSQVTVLEIVVMHALFAIMGSTSEKQGPILDCDEVALELGGLRPEIARHDLVRRGR